jgi:hypothetical protein
MMPPPLEDRLNRLADDVAAPATPDARQAIGRRAARLRRRRRVGSAVGGGLVALLILAGAVALQAKDPADVETDIAGPGELPALTIDLDGWQVVAAEDTTATPDTAGVDDPASGSLQVFRRPGDLAGPSVFLHHEAASDAIAASDTRPVTIGGAEGYLEQTGPDSFSISWNPVQSDSQADLEARGLTQPEVIDFANGLRVKDPDIRYPPAPGTRFGFVAERLPKGLREIPVGPASPGPSPGRRLVAERDGATIEITIDDRGEAAFETGLAELLATGGAAERVSVLGNPAVLVEHPDGRWSLVWRQTDGATVIASLSDVDRSTVDDVVGGLDEISEGEWQDMKADHRSSADTGSTAPSP